MENIRSFTEFCNHESVISDNGFNYINEDIKMEKEKNEVYIGDSRIDGYPMFRSTIGNDVIVYKKTPNGHKLINIETASHPYEELNPPTHITDNNQIQEIKYTTLGENDEIKIQKVNTYDLPQNKNAIEYKPEPIKKNLYKIYEEPKKENEKGLWNYILNFFNF